MSVSLSVKCEMARLEAHTTHFKLKLHTLFGLRLSLKFGCEDRQADNLLFPNHTIQT